MAIKLGSEKRNVKSSETTPIYRKKLEGGVLGEANKDGSIFLSKDIPKGSQLESEVIGHEKASFSLYPTTFIRGRFIRPINHQFYAPPPFLKISLSV